MKDPKLWKLFCERFSTILEGLPHHHEIAQGIIRDWEQSPNILMYSAIGFPMAVYWDHIMHQKFGKFQRKECTFKKDVTYFETPFFFELDFLHPSNTKAMDHMQELIKMIISSSCIHSDRHIIFCKNIDAIDDIYAFRVLLERYSKNAMFVCTTHCLSNIEAPIRSRFYTIRVPLFTFDEINFIMSKLDVALHPKLQETQCRNIYKAIAIADICQSHPIEEHSKICSHNFPMIHQFFQDYKHPTIDQIRTLSNKICQQNVPFASVVEDLLWYVPDGKKLWFIQQVSKLQHMLSTTNKGREPLYYEFMIHVATYGHLLKKQICHS
jgi:hypothetical protein